MAKDVTSPPPPPLDPNTPLKREPLPADLQNLVDNEERLLDQIYDGTASDSTSSNLRYAAYATRLRTILLSAHRYVAYTSDIGESFRPIAHPYLVKSAYAISWAYLLGDVSHEGYKAYLRNQRVKNPGAPGVLSTTSEGGAAGESREISALGPPRLEERDGAAGGVSGSGEHGVAGVYDS
ncbi:hypothetical protein MMC20_006940 [Loxospora ochrophaea]|nr:hypothetical protein [Loxospora ochrophaea]